MDSEAGEGVGWSFGGTKEEVVGGQVMAFRRVMELQELGRGAGIFFRSYLIGEFRSLSGDCARYRGLGDVSGEGRRRETSGRRGGAEFGVGFRRDFNQSFQKVLFR